ncbi:MAG TPA: hypothetical protein VHF25_04015 [Nitriliruptorales bacterium]|nr:hypothetical protein [Nitriliruptorales bacterium]
MTRRDAMRRMAVVGGSLVWAGPVVQHLGTIRAFAQASPVPPPPGPTPPPPAPTPGVEFPSNFQILVQCDDFGATIFGLKFDEGDDPTWDKIGSGTTCDFANAFANPSAAVISHFVAEATVTKDFTTGSYILRLPSDCELIEGRPKDGTCRQEGHEDACGAPVTANPDGTFTFSKC